MPQFDLGVPRVWAKSFWGILPKSVLAHIYLPPITKLAYGLSAQNRTKPLKTPAQSGLNLRPKTALASQTQNRYRRQYHKKQIFKMKNKEVYENNFKINFWKKRK